MNLGPKIETINRRNNPNCIMCGQWVRNNESGVRIEGSTYQFFDIHIKRDCIRQFKQLIEDANELDIATCFECGGTGQIHLPGGWGYAGRFVTCDTCNGTGSQSTGESK